MSLTANLAACPLESSVPEGGGGSLAKSKSEQKMDFRRFSPAAVDRMISPTAFAFNEGALNAAQSKHTSVDLAMKGGMAFTFTFTR